MKIKTIATSVMMAMALTISTAATNSYAQPATSSVQPEPSNIQQSPFSPPMPLGCGDGPCFVI
ncbi:hypothetical protein HNQ77_001952 [Silvibacterium bohemicum]|uniref:Uncharacterized protein n=1 Tax=Silvibacterium bohemicum TaxID=1577686 RepID=A0A841JRG6_9BACT|nr:hypothetical protein [Silvibacterium bohemicum]